MLTPLKTSEMNRKVVYFDTESRVVDYEHKPYLLCATFARYDLKNPYTDYVYENDTLPDFWTDVDRFTNKGETVTVYSHNCFYDLVISKAIDALTSLGYRVTSFFEKGLTFMMKFKKEISPKKFKTLECVSTTNYFSTSLSNLAKTFGFPSKLEYDYDNGSMEEAIVYCKRDVEIIRVAMESFRKMVKEEDLGPLKITIAGQSFSAYRHQFMNEDIFIHNTEKAIELERKAYYGGRVECFKVGVFDGEFFGLDINSMYPHVMQSHKYPVKLLSYRKKSTVPELKRQLKKGYGIIAHVSLKTTLPHFPYRTKTKLVFPVGEFDAYLSTPELQFALDHDLIQEVKENSLYEMAEIFAPYVNHFYAKRQEAKAAGDDVRSNMYKLFLNSLYGKFGQKSESWERIGDADPKITRVETVKNRDTGEEDVYKTFGGSIFKREEEDESFNSFCAIAAHVTAYARMLLASYIETANREHVYYSDTDSLFVDRIGYERLTPHIHQTELGKLKLEKESDTLEIYAPKDYKFGTHAKMKGVKGDALLYTDLETKTLHAVNVQWKRLNSHIHDGQLTTYRNVEVTKKLARQYNGGVIQSTGEVVPFLIKNDKILNFNLNDSQTLKNVL